MKNFSGLEKHKTTRRVLENMGTKKKGHIEKLLKKADKAIEDGIRKADEVLDEAVEFGVMAAGQCEVVQRADARWYEMVRGGASRCQNNQHVPRSKLGP